MKPLKIRLILYVILVSLFPLTGRAQGLPKDFIDPTREFSVMPFWFWNDTLKDQEIIRQIADFESHGVYGFVIHPRIGLPENIKWLSPEMLHSMDVAISEASKRNMYVVLYDEGMYPSGSSSGQVVERNPAHAARGLAKTDLKKGEEPVIPAGTKLVAVSARPGGSRIAVIEQSSKGVIRGLHYISESEGGRIREETPPAGDILNPDAVSSFIELVYDKYYQNFGKYFGNTIIGIFTDEPSALGRSSARGIVPGNASLLPQIKKILGYDFKPYLADLWYNDTPASLKHRADYYRAVNVCLEENYYKRLGNWCFLHNISLMGHPAGSMDIGAEKYFQIPGQDLVWRYVEPGPKALEGEHSTMAKCASSAMLHLGYRRNANELYGAYGHNLTYDEMVWLAGWCFIRGQNLLIPHAFFYSVRGPRFDERPPDVGPHSAWWNNYNNYADACRRLSWLNTDSRQVCSIAIMCDATWLPDVPAKTLFLHQLDFNYLEPGMLKDAIITPKGASFGGVTYSVVIIDSISSLPRGLKPLIKKLSVSGHLIINARSKYASEFKGALIYTTQNDLLNAVNKLTLPDIILEPGSANIRFRHVVKNGDDYFMLFNEGTEPVSAKMSFPVTGSRYLPPSFLITDVFRNKTETISSDMKIDFNPFDFKIIFVPGPK